jgi:hypothetical protein
MFDLLGHDRKRLVVFATRPRSLSSGEEERPGTSGTGYTSTLISANQRIV